MTLDTVAGLLCLWMAFCIFGLFVVSSTKRRNWMNIPEYVRRGFIVSGAMFAWRGFNFLSLEGVMSAPGHINAEGLMATVAMAYTITALTVWQASAKLPIRAWERLQHAARVMRRDPNAVPVLVQASDITDIAHASGQPAVGPNEGPAAVAREGPRYSAMKERNQ